ncbi:MAG: DNA repair protein RecO [Neisseria sp.]|nr:DNA repair protein RecO [Neisseria sp.]
MSRINREPAFVLSSAPWRESSLRVEVFSRHHGRVSLLARSARKRQSELRGVLVPFVPLTVSWFGQNELRTLHRAEWVGGWAQPQGKNLLSALYVNELMLKLTARDDPHSGLYDALQQVMQALAQATHGHGALRVFEWQLLHACGFAPDLQYDAAGQTITADGWYKMLPEEPPQAVEEAASDAVYVHGSTLHALFSGSLHTDEALNEALRLNRMMLDFRLAGNIHSRHLVQQIIDFHRR